MLPSVNKPSPALPQKLEDISSPFKIASGSHKSGIFLFKLQNLGDGSWNKKLFGSDNKPK